MGQLRDYRPIEFRQVRAIARVLLLRTPTITDSEWKAQTRETAAKQGYDEPPTDMLDRALVSVEQEMLRTMGPRPLAADTPEPRAQKPQHAPLTPAEWHAFAQTIQNVMARSQAIVAKANVVPIARETLEISEHAALDQFYLEAADDRSAALRRFAELAILRESGWDTEVVRAAAEKNPLRPTACFACRTQSRPLAWHHVIQIQHGGSNMARNRVALCGPCHADVHPWLPKAPRVRTGWTRFTDVRAGLAALIARNRKDEAS